MYKLTPLFAIIALIGTILLCGGCGMSAADRAEQRMLDSIYTADSLRAVRHLRDSLRQADSLANADFISADLRTFWLKGRVMQVLESVDNGYTIQLLFDEQGTLLSHSAYDTDSSRIVRDGNDRIISLINIGSWEGGNDGIDIKYTPDGFPSAISHWQAGHDSYVFNRYDRHNWPLEGAITDTEDSFSGQVSYSYPAIDSRGNWTKHIAIEKWPELAATRHIVIRKIIYYR